MPGRRAEHVAAGQCAGHDGCGPTVGHGSRAAEPRAEGAGSGRGRGLHDELAGGRGVLDLYLCCNMSNIVHIYQVDMYFRKWTEKGAGGWSAVAA